MLTITLVDGIALRQLPFEHMIARVASLILKDRADAEGRGGRYSCQQYHAVAKALAGTWQIGKIEGALKIEVVRQDKIIDERLAARRWSGEYSPIQPTGPAPGDVEPETWEPPNKETRFEGLIACRLKGCVRSFLDTATGYTFDSWIRTRERKVRKSAITLLVRPRMRWTHTGRTSATRAYVIHIPRKGKPTCYSVPGETMTIRDAFLALMPVGGHKDRSEGLKVQPDWKHGRVLVWENHQVVKRLPFRKTAISAEGAKRLKWKVAS